MQSDSGPIYTSAEVLAISRSLLGSSYNPITGTLGAIRCIEPSDPLIRFTSDCRFSRVTMSAGAQNKTFQLKLPFVTKPLHEDLYNSPALSSPDPAGAIFAVKEIATAFVNTSRLYASRELLLQVNGLPAWDCDNEETLEKYSSFFDRYGTHFLRSAALGGIVSLLLPATSLPSFDTIVGLLQHGCAPGTHLHSEILGSRCDGGEVRANAISSSLPILFNCDLDESQRKSEWLLDRDKWIDDVREEPIFLPNEITSDYEWMYNLSDIPENRYEDLREGAKWYLEVPTPENMESSPEYRTENASGNFLPREELGHECDPGIGTGTKVVTGILCSVVTVLAVAACVVM